MSKRTRAENRAKRDAARASQHPFKRPHPDPWKRLPPAGAEVDDRGVVKAVLRAASPAVPGAPGSHVTDAPGIEGDPVGALSEMLRVAGARVTLDPSASIAKPCWRCGTTAEPRGLETIGVYARWMGGNLEPGDKIRRPLCGACNEATQAGDGGELGHAEALTELAEERRLRERLTAICERTVLALRGPHPEGAIWGWHDLPELAAAAKAAPPPASGAPAEEPGEWRVQAPRVPGPGAYRVKVLGPLNPNSSIDRHLYLDEAGRPAAEPRCNATRIGHAVTDGAASPPFDLDLFVEAFLSVIDEKPSDAPYVGRFGEVQARETVLGRMARRAGVTAPKAVFERVLVVYDAWCAARPKPRTEEEPCE